jgi:hypothetical protein
MKIKKNGKVVNLTEKEIKQIITKQKINRFLNEQAILTMRDEIHDLMKSYERIINSKVRGIDVLPESKIEDIMGKVKRAMLQNVEELRKAVSTEENNRVKKEQKK